MAHIYVMDSAAKLGLKQGQIIIRNSERQEERHIPLANVDGISVYGMAQLSTQLIRTCLSEGIPIGYYTDDGHYIGKTSSFGSLDPTRQKRQILLTDNPDFCLNWSKEIVSSKIRNSLKLLESECNRCGDEERSKCSLRRSLKSIDSAESVEACIGYEGDAARGYFHCLGTLIQNDTFVFSGRSTRPPKDPFNAMLSYGYSLLYRNIVGAIERHGLHPYFGFMHKLKSGHAALASDLIEDCRASLVDKVVLDMVNAKKVSIEGFTKTERGAVYMDKRTARHVTNAFSDALVRKRRYFLSSGDSKRYGFQVMLDMKLVSVLNAIDHGDVGRYTPYVWR